MAEFLSAAGSIDRKIGAESELSEVSIEKSRANNYPRNKCKLNCHINKMNSRNDFNLTELQ